MKRKFVILSVFIVIIIILNIFLYIFFKYNNSIFKDKCFIIEGNSYYAFEDNDAYGTINFIIVDSTGKVSATKSDGVKGELISEKEIVKINNITIDANQQNLSYSSYFVTCNINLNQMELDVDVFSTLNIEGVGKFNIGKVMIDKVDCSENANDLELGYHIENLYENQYSINVLDVPSGVEFDKVVIKDMDGNELPGSWVNGNVSGNVSGDELNYKYDKTLNYLYVKPIIEYEYEGEKKVNTALIATSYMDEISKEEMEEYIRSKY